MGRKSQVDAFSYLRVSGKGQVEGHGFTRQRQSIRRYARAHGVQVVTEYRDEGVTGTNGIEDRPGLSALLAAVEANSVKLVLVEHPDRLARDLLVSEVILADFRAVDVTVIAADGGINLTDNDDPDRVMVRQIVGAVAQADKARLVRRLRAAREAMRAETGRCEGQKPFGSLPGEAATVERIRQLRRKPKGRRRLSVAKIAAILNAEGCPTRHGRPWQPRTVLKILDRPFVKPHSLVAECDR